MNAISRTIGLCFCLCMTFAAAPAVAQDAMQGVDMPPMQHAAKKPAKHVAKMASKVAVKQQLPKTKSSKHSMQGVAMSPMPDMTTAMPPQRPPASKQHTQHASAMPGMNMSPMSGMPMQPPPRVTGKLHKLDIGSQIGSRPVARGLNLEPMQMDMHGMSMQGGKAPPDARSADYSDGIGYGTMPGLHTLDDAALGMVLIDRLEYFDGRNGNGVALDAQGWYGTDADKVWIKAEGETGAGRLQDLRTEALWAHPIGIYWNTQLGVRHDFGAGPGRTWAAFGVQGLAPYFFDVEATFYVGQAGRTAFRFESEYELLLTQRLILQPRFEVHLYGRDDPQRGIGSGLSDATAGLRLRYEFTRKFAPYVGIEFDRKFGRTADFARAAGEPAFDPRLVAGLHFWF